MTSHNDRDPRAISAEKEEARRIYADTGIITSNALACEMASECLRSKRVFPDVLVEVVASWDRDFRGGHIGAYDRKKLVLFFHRFGLITDAQLADVFRAHPELPDALHVPPAWTGLGPEDLLEELI